MIISHVAIITINISLPAACYVFASLCAVYVNVIPILSRTCRLIKIQECFLTFIWYIHATIQASIIKVPRVEIFLNQRHILVTVFGGWHYGPQTDSKARKTKTFYLYFLATLAMHICLANCCNIVIFLPVPFYLWHQIWLKIKPKSIWLKKIKIHSSDMMFINFMSLFMLLNIVQVNISYINYV